jgi:acyl transferase domain-containing protein
LSQERLERSVYDTFGIDPERIQMVEAHGTGTRLGDPIEYLALQKAFRHYTDKKHFCALGSIKTNIGHTTAAAGVAGVIKVLLSMQHRQIPPSLHFEIGNAHINFKTGPFYVNTMLQDWTNVDGSPRCAAVSSFGMSGTNAHIVIEEPPAVERRHVDRPSYLFVLSARTADQLRRQAERLMECAVSQPALDCGNASYTLMMGRRHFAHRLAWLASDTQELIAALRQWLSKGKGERVFTAEPLGKDRREQASLKGYGNQCIEECSVLADMGTYAERLAAVGELYVQGYRLEFARLFAGGGYSRVSLPTYAFARERYWPETANTQLMSQPTSPTPKLPRRSSDNAVLGEIVDRLLAREIDLDGAVAKASGLLDSGQL